MLDLQDKHAEGFLAPSSTGGLHQLMLSISV